MSESKGLCALVLAAAAKPSVTAWRIGGRGTNFAYQSLRWEKNSSKFVDVSFDLSFICTLLVPLVAVFIIMYWGLPLLNNNDTVQEYWRQYFQK